MLSALTRTTDPIGCLVSHVRAAKSRHNASQSHVFRDARDCPSSEDEFRWDRTRKEFFGFTLFQHNCTQSPRGGIRKDDHSRGRTERPKSAHQRSLFSLQHGSDPF